MLRTLFFTHRELAYYLSITKFQVPFLSLYLRGYLDLLEVSKVYCIQRTNQLRMLIPRSKVELFQQSCLRSSAIAYVKESTSANLMSSDYSDVALVR